MNQMLQVFINRRMLIVSLLGFSSGLPLALTAATLQAWMKTSHLDLATIGRFSLIGLPYTVKFLWSPWLDSVAPPFWGRRRGWALIIQLCLAASIVGLAFCNPVESLTMFSLAAFAVAFFSASQDIVVDAFRTELLKPEELGAGAGVYVMGYRIGMLVSGALGLILADLTSWRNVYLLMAGLVFVGVLTVWLAPEPEIKFKPYLKLRDRVVLPFVDFFKRNGAMEILIFVMIYKLSTMMATALTTPFLLDMGFTNTQIGSVTKVAGLIATIVGTLTGGALMTKIPLKSALWLFGVAQALAGLTFFGLAQVGYNLPLMTLVIIIENFMLGLGVAALQGFMMKVCSKQFTGTQFALLSSLTAVNRVVLVSQAGVIAESLGWSLYFVVTIPLAIPGLLLLLRYDQWEDALGAEKRSISMLDLVTVMMFVVSLLAISSEPLWSWLGSAEIGSWIARSGAVGVGIAVLVGILKPARRSPRAMAAG